MKAVLEFNLGDEDERSQFSEAIYGARYKRALLDFYNDFRAFRKYSEYQKLSSGDTVEKIWEMWTDALNGIDLMGDGI